MQRTYRMIEEMLVRDFVVVRALEDTEIGRIADTVMNELKDYGEDVTEMFTYEICCAVLSTYIQGGLLYERKEDERT